MLRLNMPATSGISQVEILSGARSSFRLKHRSGNNSLVIGVTGAIGTGPTVIVFLMTCFSATRSILSRFIVAHILMLPIIMALSAKTNLHGILMQYRLSGVLGRV